MGAYKSNPELDIFRASSILAGEEVFMGSIDRFFILFLIGALVLSPAMANAVELSEKSEENLARGAADGKTAALRQVKWPVWLGCGCLGNLLGVGIAALAVPGPRMEQLIGKPPLYVMAFTDAYKKELRTRQVRYALFGCAVAGLIGGVGLAIMCANTDINCGGDGDCGDNIECGSSGTTCGDIVSGPAAEDF